MLVFLHALVLALTLLSGMTPAIGQPASPNNVSERSLKAAYLYKFLSYIEWPAGSFPTPDSPYVIGVAGDPELAFELRSLIAGRRVNQRPVAVQILGDGDAPDGVHLLYAALPSAARQEEMLKAVRGRPTVSVTDEASHENIDSVINFRRIDGRIRFEVSLVAAAHCNCKLSARMLSVALLVGPPVSR